MSCRQCVVCLLVSSLSVALLMMRHLQPRSTMSHALSVGELASVGVRDGTEPVSVSPLFDVERNTAKERRGSSFSVEAKERASPVPASVSVEVEVDVEQGGKNSPSLDGKASAELTIKVTHTDPADQPDHMQSQTFFTGMPALVSSKGHLEPVSTKFYRDSEGKPRWFLKERFEHGKILKWVRPDSKVLEIGSRYGSSSCMVAWVQKNSGQLVSVEGDSSVWEAQAENMKNLRCNNKIWRGVVSYKKWKKSREKNGSEWTTKFEITNDPHDADAIRSISFSELQTSMSITFDTLIVDCEGCFEKWLEEFPDAVDKIRTILLEADYGISWQPQGYANYDHVTEMLTSKGFEVKEKELMTNYEWSKGGRIYYFVFARSRPRTLVADTF